MDPVLGRRKEHAIYLITKRSALLPIALLWALLAFSSAPAAGAETQGDEGRGPVPVREQSPAEGAQEVSLPDQRGVSLEYGYVYDPDENLSFTVARFFAIYDYGSAWHSRSPTKALRFKVEGAVGSTVTPDASLIASVNMLALYYPWLRPQRTFRPYVEGGIGVIYTGFRVKGEGLHFNFNPLLGVGVELPQQDGRNPFAALRMHHISNGMLYHENRGVNSVLLQVGRYF